MGSEATARDGLETSASVFCISIMLSDNYPVFPIYIDITAIIPAIIRTKKSEKSTVEPHLFM